MLGEVDFSGLYGDFPSMARVAGLGIFDDQSPSILLPLSNPTLQRRGGN